MSTGNEHPVDLRQTGVRFGQMLDDVSQQDNVKRTIFERKLIATSDARFTTLEWFQHFVRDFDRPQLRIDATDRS